jgi:hypothetical protein
LRDIFVICFWYPIAAYMRNWPSRYDLLIQLLDLEYKQNVIMTETDDGDLLVDQHVLQSGGIMKSPDRGEAFLQYFNWVNADLEVNALGKVENLVEHESLMHQIKELHTYKSRLANESSTRDSSRGRGTTEARSRASGGAGNKRKGDQVSHQAEDTEERSRAGAEKKKLGGADGRSQRSAAGADTEAQQELVKAIFKELLEMKQELRKQHLPKQLRNSVDADTVNV